MTPPGLVTRVRWLVAATSQTRWTTTAMRTTRETPTRWRMRRRMLDMLRRGTERADITEDYQGSITDDEEDARLQEPKPDSDFRE
eukprot:4592423-Pleurochrysis_carterae.AAC.1